MMLLLTLSPARFPQVSRSRGVHVVHEFVKCYMIPEVELEIDLRANIFGVSDRLDTLQDDKLKNDHPLNIPLPSLYSIEIH